MGIYGALATAVSGLSAQAYALDNISGNIANSQTTAYKRNDTTFLDLVTAPAGQQGSGSVIASARQTLDQTGSITNVDSATSMAIKGSGFFVVEPKLGENDGNAVFGGSNYYTRRGDFSLDKDGYLVNGAGYYLKGLPIDSTTGNISGSVPQVIKISNAFLPAQGTTRIDYNLNLPQMPQPSGYDSTVANSQLLDTSSYADSSGTAYDPTTAGTGTVLGTDGDTFLSQSISGGAVTVYADNGSAADVQLRWAKTDSASLGTGHSDTWNLFYLKNSDATGDQVMWQNAGQDFTFGADGHLTSPTTPTITLPGLSVNGTSVGDVELNYGTNGITEFADANGSASVNSLSQNGYAAGQFNSISINDNGRVVATYSNGQQSELAQIVTSNFNAPDKLEKLDGGIYSATSESGGAIVSTDGSKIVGSALEGSNTDISSEFSKLIVTQQAYAAGTKIVTTSNQMLQQALNMIR